MPMTNVLKAEAPPKSADPTSRVACLSLSFRLPDRARIHSIVSLAHQPVGDTESERNRGQAQQLCRAHAIEVEDNELPGDCQKSDEKHDLGLNDALLALHEILQRVIELQRDQQGQDLAEHRLKDAMIERVENAKQQPRYDAERQADKRDENYQPDDERENQRNKPLETLVVREYRPLRLQLTPRRTFGHHGLPMRVTDLTVEAWRRRPSQDNRPMVRRRGASGQRLASLCRRSAHRPVFMP